MSLAIIIPAYKSDFLDRALSSIANQTDKDFNVYIGDDCSPYNIEEVVDKYRDKVNITYQRFDKNLGGTDLVKQWERCIAMSNDEEWIWLFSDDDIMDKNCVAEFKKSASSYPDANIFHFNVNVINNFDDFIKESVYPSNISSEDLYIGKLKGTLDCYVVEFIFRRRMYDKFKGFVNFDLAWGSDLATWVNFGLATGIQTIPNARVNWRSSGENISTTYSIDILKRKASALLKFLQWGEKTLSSKDLRNINTSGLLRRLTNMSVMTNYSFGKPFLKRYSKNNLEYHTILLKYTILYIAKKSKNVFQR